MTSPLARQLGREVDAFWMRPCDLRILDLLRRCYGILLIVYVALLWVDRRVFYGNDSYLPPKFAKQVTDRDAWSLYSIAPGTPIVIDSALLLLAAGAIALVLGAYPRLAAGGIFFLLIAMQHANILLIDGEDILFRLFAFFLVFVPPWHQLRTSEPSQLPAGPTAFVFPAWPLRLFQLELCLVYLCAATQKANGPEWLDGTALYYPLRLDDFSRFALPGQITESLVAITILTWAVVLFEFLIPVLIWWPRTRGWCLLGAFLFHAGTDYAMNLHLFHWIMLVGLLSFVRYEEWLSVRRWLGLPFRFLSRAARSPVRAEASHRTTSV